jgi:hypothetical protein
MVTRAFTGLVLAFWLVMTVLLVRYTYFPEGSKFAEVPPRVVMKLFLDQGAKNNAMHVYHYEKKIGHAAFDARKVRSIDSAPGDRVTHVIKINGLLERGMLSAVKEPVIWRMEARLKGMEEFEFFKAHIFMQDSGLTADFVWNVGDRTPKISLSTKGGTSPEAQMLQNLLSQVLGSGTLPGGEAAPSEDSVQLSTREGSMNIGGQKRQGFTMEIGAAETWRMKAFFTEAGELALVTLPDGYRLMEQTIYGLAPDYGEEEEEE